MKKNVLLFGAGLLAMSMTNCSSQGNDELQSEKNTMDTITTSTGLQYVITHKGTGKKANTGDKVVAHYTGKLTDGTVFDSSVERNKPFEFPVGKGRVIKGWDEGFSLLQVGDKATLIIPSHLGYGERGAPPSIPANATLVFDVELLDVKERVVPKAFDIAGKETKATPSGLQYIMVQDGSGEVPAVGQKVLVHYTGYLEDGTIFDSSVERGQPLPFPLGQGKVIKGWDEGIGLLKVGGKARLIIPSDLAYGDQGYPGMIPPKATLIFDVELVGIQ